MITVPKPEANFAWAFPATSNGDEVEVQLKNQTQAAVQSFWTLNGESTSAGSLELKVPGVYAVSLEANNEHGCVDDIEKEIHVGNLNGLLAQSRFSPNGDGRYDTFMPHGLKDMDGTWEIVIADIAGQEVYRTSNASMPWDGVLPNGSLAAGRSSSFGRRDAWMPKARPVCSQTDFRWSCELLTFRIFLWLTGATFEPCQRSSLRGIFTS